MADYTLADLQELAAHASGVVVGPSKRHKPNIVQRMLNESIAQYYMRLTDGGHPHATTRATLTTSASTDELLGWPANSYVGLPSDFMALLAIRIQTGFGGWVKLVPFGEGDEDDTSWLFASDDTGTPERFRLGTASDGTDIVRLKPSAASSYTIEVVYVPRPAEIAEDETAKLIDGTADWVVCDTALKMLESDGVPEPTQAQLLIARKNKADDILIAYASRKNRTGPVAMQDTRSMRGARLGTRLFR